MTALLALTACSLSQELDGEFRPVSDAGLDADVGADDEAPADTGGADLGGDPGDDAVDPDDTADLPDAPLPCAEPWVEVLSPDTGVTVTDLNTLVTPDGVLYITFKGIRDDTASVAVMRVQGRTVEQLRIVTAVKEVFSPALAFQGGEIWWYWGSDDPDGGEIHRGRAADGSDIGLFGIGGAPIADFAPSTDPDRDVPLYVWSQQGFPEPPLRARCELESTNCLLLGDGTSHLSLADSLVAAPRPVKFDEHDGLGLALWFDPSLNALNFRRVDLSDDQPRAIADTRGFLANPRAPHPTILGDSSGWMVAFLGQDERIQTTMIPRAGPPINVDSAFLDYSEQQQPFLVAGTAHARILLFVAGMDLVAATLSPEGTATNTAETFAAISNLSHNGIAASTGIGPRELAVVLAADNGVRAVWLDENLQPVCPPEF